MWTSGGHPLLGPTTMGEKIIHDVYVIHQSSFYYRNVFKKHAFQSFLFSSSEILLVFNSYFFFEIR